MRNTDSYGTTYITDATITGNRTTGNLGAGGGLYFRSAGTFASISGTTISANTTSGLAADGAGLAIQATDTTVVVSQSTISGNRATGADGAGVYFNGAGFGALILQNSTVASNRASGAFSVGGGIFAVTSDNGLAILDSSTISGNSAHNHGGGFALGYAAESWISYSTITNNTSDADNSGTGQGGGLFLDLNADVTLKHTIVADNTDRTGTAPDLRLILGSLTPSFSLLGDNRGSGVSEANPDGNGNLVGGSVGGVIDPQLGPLADNGGPTLTQELLPGSPAIDAGNPGISNPPPFDQRGFARVADGRIDIGAFEFNAAPPTPDGDFNDDNVYDCQDIDAMVAEIAAGTNRAMFDLSGDGLVDLVDRDLWLAEAVRRIWALAKSIWWRTPI